MGKGRSYMKSYADGYMKGKVVKEVGALLDHIPSNRQAASRYKGCC